ncbi:serine dehydratase subunit alpha family protein [Faecalicatena contorta]|uniref:L-cysteine desulfidase family protein n=1 Tax=Faecalicatena contorta TaxID=39482 RepID=UPI001961353B|nr:L-serine ammonia-lyase, iron-sulfur-dependent, subunit alpha [Faecalicatena contorta]MBM6684980.1 serine dehydratase subunit alpha family protein [Faecalicatena contorta]MBM6710508.1 serine dehydratase subunit alpha family protein [Faecalicatena contorta]
MNQKTYDSYVKILKTELVPALGCTEPIALAYASAKAVDLLGDFPERMEALCSGNIIKNVKGVKVPCSGGLKGVEAAVILGACGGDSSRELEVLESVQEEDRARTNALLREGFCTCLLKEGVPNLFIEIHAFKGTDSSVVRIEQKHTNITYMEQNGRVLFEKESSGGEQQADKSLLNLGDIIAFAREVNLSDVRDCLERQIQYNMAISEEGLAHQWGAGVGRMVLEEFGQDVRWRAIARAAAGSDARMSGCSLPVIIISGSGNQGMTCSLPVIEYARSTGKSQEELLRALCVSNLTAQDQKRYIGPLSAYCGAVCAAAGAGAGITYLCGGTAEQIENTVVNTIVNAGGITCDGAKPSCAAKIFSSLQAAFLGHSLAMRGFRFEAGEGLAMDTAEETVKAIGYMGREGMRQTDIEILNLMIGKTDVSSL